jgi:metal-responsive CopG/Arc/MetJ family transcriptional regulator
MAIYYGMGKGNARHIYLDDQQEQILDAIIAAKAKRRLDVEASRSQLIKTAVRNYIDECMEEEDLREAIVEARKHLASSRKT